MESQSEERHQLQERHGNIKRAWCIWGSGGNEVRAVGRELGER